MIDQLDVRIFLRVPHDVLKKRRHERHGYHTAGRDIDDYRCGDTEQLVQSSPEGSLWRDPPHYWEQIVYPAYVAANEGMFEGGDLEHGEACGKVTGLVVLEPLDVTMSALVDTSCRRLSAVSAE